MSARRPRGLFVGLSGLDAIHLVDSVPASDEKVVSRELALAAGGPAANAAVAFAALGGEALLITRIGNDGAGAAVRGDLESCGLKVLSVPSFAEEPIRTPVTSILITEATGERAVISHTDGGRSAAALAAATASGGGRAAADYSERRAYLDAHEQARAAARDFCADVLLVDSHEIDLSIPVCAEARRAGTPVLLDVGARKAWTGLQLPVVSVPVVSAAYRAGGTWKGCEASGAETGRGQREARLAAIRREFEDAGTEGGVVTGGSGPVSWWTRTSGIKATAPESIRAVDTLGAGDFFHGALAYAFARDKLIEPTEEAISFACSVAALSAQSFGSRQWLAGLAGLAGA